MGEFIAGLLMSVGFRMVLIIIGLFLVGKGYFENKNQLNLQSIREADTKTTIVKTQNHIDKQTPVLIQDHAEKPSERITVNVSAEYLTGFFREHTSIQADKLAEAYLGKWMQVSGYVKNVWSSSAGKEYHLILIHQPDKEPKYPSVYCLLNFGMEWSERLSVIKRDDPLTAIGKILKVASSDLELSECEVLNQ